MKKFFNIKTKYEFDINDIRVLLTLINFYLILNNKNSLPLIIAASGLFGMMRDYFGERKINSFLIHFVGLCTGIFYFIIG